MGSALRQVMRHIIEFHVSKASTSVLFAQTRIGILVASKLSLSHAQAKPKSPLTIALKKKSCPKCVLCNVQIGPNDEADYLSK